MSGAPIRTAKILHRRLFGLALIVLLVACCWQWAIAQTAVPGDQRIIHESWAFKDGAPDAVWALAQTSDDYLWLGTSAGLYRFDGIRFELFRSPFGDQLLTNNIAWLFAPPTGGLWIGNVTGGVSFLKNGRITNFPEVPGTVYSFAQDRQGIVWAATDGGLWRFDGSKWQPVGAEWNAPQKPVSQVGFDREGVLWVLTESRDFKVAKQLYFLPPGDRQFRKAGDNLFVQGFTLDADNVVLTTHERKSQEPGSGVELEGSLPAYPILKKDSEQILDRANGIWFLSVDPLIFRHAAGEPLAEIVSKASRVNSQVYDINAYRYARLVDREGSIWIGDPTGVHRFTYSPLIQPQFPKPAGSRFTVAPDDGGVVWISAGNGTGSSVLYRVADGKVEFKGAQRGLTNLAYRAPDRTFWFGGEGGLWHMVNGSLTKIELPQEMDKAWLLTTATQDGSGGTWVAFGRYGLYRFKGGVWTKFGGRSDFPSTGAVIAFTDALGRIWFTCPKSVLAVLDGDRIQTYSATDGLQVGRLMAVSGRGSEIWIGGEFGVQQFDHGRFHTIHAVDKESLRGISGIVETANGDLWLNGLGGIVHLRRAEILEALKNPAYLASCERFDRRAGLPGRPSPALPTAVEGTDGRLWFTVNNGVVWLDPTRASNKVAPPPISIQSVSADDKGYALDQPLRLPAGTSNVKISYAAVSLLNPESIRFRYKMRGDWHEAGTSTSVNYRNLPPGTYQFVVNASDTNGVWSDKNAVAEFTILPAFYQTNWFRALCVAAFLAVLWAAYFVRVRQLRRQEKQLRDVVDTIPTFAWTALPDGSIDFSNRYWAEYTGLSSEKTVGTGWEAAVHPEDLNRYRPTWRSSVQAGKAFEREVRFRRADGAYHWFLVRAVPMRGAGGRIVKWYGTATDIEDRKRAEELQADLAHINRLSMMGELAASISHELKQPIAATIMNANTSLRWLKREQPDMDEVREAAERIVQDGRRAAEIIDRLRSLYKQSLPQRELVQVSEIVREMVVLLRGEANRHGISVRTDLADDLSNITADRVQLQQVLMNLMLNAIEAMSETGGVLTVKSQLDQDGRVLISVSDTGVGLPAEKAEQIFDAFFTTKAQGSGMGLAISRSIIQSHGGRLWATANEGRGATFHFTLPTTAEEATAAGSGR